jgi:hypothetical protein
VRGCCRYSAPTPTIAGRLDESRGELALARQRAAELKARMADARNAYQQAAAEELKTTSARPA